MCRLAALALASSLSASTSIDSASHVDELLARHGAGDPAERRAVADEFARLSVDTMPALLPWLFHERVPAGGTPVLASAQEGLLLDTLRAWPATSVSAALGEHASGDLTRALRAFPILGEVGDARAVDTALDLLASLDTVHVAHPRVASACATALCSITKRDPRAAERIAVRSEDIPTALLPALAKGLGEYGRWAALRPMEGMRGRGTAADVALVAGLGAWKRWDIGAASCRGIVAEYLGAYDPRLRRAAVTAAGQLQDWNVVPDLIDLLESPERGVAVAAETALRSISGGRSFPDATGWDAWLAEEAAWREQELPRLLSAAAESAPTAGLKALREIALHPWFAREAVDRVTDLLGSEDVSIALTACEALRCFGDNESAFSLQSALGDRRAEVRRAARMALVSMTGVDMGEDAEAWLPLLEA